jgi:chromosome segregation ATPase
MTYIAFTSLPIATGDTSPIWFALNEPTEQSITQLRNEVSALEDEVAALRAKDESQDAKITQLEGQVELNRQNIATLNNKVAALEAKDIEHNLAIQELTRRVAALEAIPLALVSYKEGKEIVRSQITWKGYGNLFQCAETYIPTGNFDADVAAGYLVPVTSNAEDISGITTKLNETTETADNALSTATATAETVDAMSETVSGLIENVSSISTSVSAHSETLTNHETRITTLENNE